MEKNFLHFYVIIPAFNCEDFVERCLVSVLSQDYPNYTTLFIDDASTDKTFENAKDVQNKFPNKNFLLKKNATRRRRTENLVHAIRNDVPSTSIVVLVDGDDHLANNQVLKRLNAEYSNKDTWLTVGGFCTSDKEPEPRKCHFNLWYPEDYIKELKFRTTKWATPHLVTFYCWLFLLIDVEDFKHNGEFLTSASDVAMVIPMLEMANGRFASLVSEELYVYNIENPRSIYKDYFLRFAQVENEYAIRNKKPYTPLADYIAPRQYLSVFNQ